MRPIITALLVLGLAPATAAAGKVTALTGATLIDGTGAEPVPDAIVVVADGRIQCAGKQDTCPIPDGASVRDFSDHWITPGLVDAHVHYAQTGWADGRPDSLDVRERYPYPEVQAALRENPGRWHRSHLCNGVTAVFDVGGYPWTWNVRGPARSNPDAPHYAAAGPLLSTYDHWLNLPAERQFVYLDDRDTAREAVDYLAAFDTDAVKLWFIVTGEHDFDELKVLAKAAGRRAGEHGLPFIVHATGLREAEAAVAAGADVLVHSVDDEPASDAFVDSVVDNDVIYIPTLTVMEGYYRQWRSAITGKAPSVADPLGCVDSELRGRVAETKELKSLTGGRGPDWLRGYRERLDGEREVMETNLKRLAKAGATVATGTDAGNPLTLHGAAINAEMEAMQAAGLSPMEVIVASTRNGARAMGRADEFGTLESGKAADLLVLAADPAEDVAHFRELVQVMRAGVLREQAELRAE
jgi:imidazolonepropionase-like amidohydrolase